jgi:hypothetical protein
VHAAAFNLGLVMRRLLGRGTPRGLQGHEAALFLTLLRLLGDVWTRQLTLASYLECLQQSRTLSQPVNDALLATTKTTTSTTGC